MSEQHFTTAFTVDRTPQDAFEAVNDPRAWWSEGIEGVTDQVGGVFDYEVEGIHTSKIRVTELVPGKRVVWHVLDGRIMFVADEAEWNGTDIRFDITPLSDSSTELRFTHVGLVPAVECYGACEEGWSYYVNGSLRQLLDEGTGTPNSLPAEVRLQDERMKAR